MRIHFAIQCHSFQRRLCWQLSSIAQQVSANTELPTYQFSDQIPSELGPMPHIVVDIAYMPGNGVPSTENVIGYYRHKGLHIKATPIEDVDLFAKRGLVRNIQTEEAEAADWIFYADCDNVYHPHFFCLLARSLEQYDGPPKCIYSKEKHHTEVKPTNDLANMALTNKGINYAYERACDLPRTDKQNKPVAAGCMQVVRPEWTDGYYVKSSNDRHLFNHGQKARSDIRFRKRIGGSYHIELPAQIHMGHRRDKEEGRHLNEQR